MYFQLMTEERLPGAVIGAPHLKKGSRKSVPGEKTPDGATQRQIRQVRPPRYDLAVFDSKGFDAFGIHSENSAIKRGIHPRILTARNVERFREEQLKRIGNRFDWSHELNTTDPVYYRWTQWIFLQLFKGGLAERKTAAVNWCPKDKTVLADEQVIHGRCERCGSIVDRRWLKQWFLKLTNYAQRLLDDLDQLDWSERG